MHSLCARAEKPALRSKTELSPTQESSVHDHNDFDFEDRPGIPAPLPAGEQVLWQGHPDFREIAKSAFHIRKIAIYFLLILVVQTVSTLRGDADSQNISLTPVSYTHLTLPTILPR